MSVGTAFLAGLRLAVPGRQVWDARVAPVKGRSGYEAIDRDGYVVAYIPAGDSVWVTAGGPPAGRNVVVRTHSFGPSRSAAEFLSDKLVGYITTHGVDIPGWGTAFVLTEDGHFSQPPVDDNDVPEFPVVRIYDEFRFLITRTT